MPVTFVVMTIGLAALAGVPPFAGFFSKDQIIGAASLAARGETVAPVWVGIIVFAFGLITVVLTAWYVTRLWLRAFFGVYRGTELPHDPPPLMRWPVLILAVPAALARVRRPVRCVQPNPRRRHRAGVTEPGVECPASTCPAFGADWDLSTLISVLLVAVGVAAAWAVWRRDPAADPDRVLGPAASGLRQRLLSRRRSRTRPWFARSTRSQRWPARGETRSWTVRWTGIGTETMRAGGWIAAWHRGALSRAGTAVLAGALLIGRRRCHRGSPVTGLAPDRAAGAAGTGRGRCGAGPERTAGPDRSARLLRRWP